VWAGVDNAWEQKKLEARKMLENAARPKGSPTRQVHPEQGRAPILNEKNQGAGTFRMCPRVGSLGRFVGRNPLKYLPSEFMFCFLP